MTDGNIRYNCNVCNRKLFISAIKCKCDKYFCANHRYNTDHNCTYDYRKNFKEELNQRLDNTNIKKIKIEKI